MNIHVVQTGETISSIAKMYGISEGKLIEDNGILNPNDLVVGQCIVIVQPERTYVVKAGDTLDNITKSNGISLLQLIRNNPFLLERKLIYPGETLVISYGEKKVR